MGGINALMGVQKQGNSLKKGWDFLQFLSISIFGHGENAKNRGNAENCHVLRERSLFSSLCDFYYQRQARKEPDIRHQNSLNECDATFVVSPWRLLLFFALLDSLASYFRIFPSGWRNIVISKRRKKFPGFLFIWHLSA